MCKVSRCLGIALALAAMVAPAWAATSLLGPSGTGTLPTAEIAATGTLTVAGDYLDTDDTTTVWRAVYGFGERLEVSAAFVSTENDVLSASAKYMLKATENSQSAVGLVYATADGVGEVVEAASTSRAEGGFATSTDTVHAYQVYAAHTMSLIPETDTSIGLIGTIGVNWTDITDTDGAFRGFASLEARRDAASLAAEFQTKNNDIEADPIFSFVARYKFANGFAAQAGWTNSFGLMGGDESRFFGGLSYTFGTK